MHEQSLIFFPRVLNQSVAPSRHTAGFNVNVGTAIAQSSYGIGCMVWVLLLHYAADDQWKYFCLVVAVPMFLAAVLVFTIYPHNRNVALEAGPAEAVSAAQKLNAHGVPVDACDGKTSLATAVTRRPLRHSQAVCALLLIIYLIWYGSSISLQTDSAAIMTSMGQPGNIYLYIYIYRNSYSA
jgi:hypothetical protein